MLRFIVSAMIAGSVLSACPAAAAGPVPVVFGQSWDGPSDQLQSVVDNTYGAGMINLQADYIGANVGDLDPWFWVGDYFSAFLVREIAGNASRNTLGWYVETGSTPVIDGIDDGIVFDGVANPGESAVIYFTDPMTKFGFYLNPNGPLGALNAPEPELFFTNRFYNDQGPDGSGALHAPFGGDMQALVFDISDYTNSNTWLVCFEDVDSGANPGPCCNTTDNDFNDLVFEVTAFGATPTVPISFGGLKAKYLKK
jgi:hypothetical protein